MPHKRGKGSAVPRRLHLPCPTTATDVVLGAAQHVGVPPPPFQIHSTNEIVVLPKGSHKWVLTAKKAAALHRRATRAASKPEEGTVPSAEELLELHDELAVLWKEDGQGSSDSPAS